MPGGTASAVGPRGTAPPFGGGLTTLLPCDIFDLRKNRLVPTKERLPLVVLRQGSNVVSWASLPHGTIYSFTPEEHQKKQNEKSVCARIEPLVRRLFLC